MQQKVREDTAVGRAISFGGAAPRLGARRLSWCAEFDSITALHIPTRKTLAMERK